MIKLSSVNSFEFFTHCLLIYDCTELMEYCASS